MGKARLRLESLVDNESYFYLEKSEDRRARKILKALPNYPKWTPISVLSKKSTRALFQQLIPPLNYLPLRLQIMSFMERDKS
jgi:hypothetical protein